MNTETTTNTTPAAWIGCLSCYNNGLLRGKWITAREAADDLNGDEITYKGQAETITTGNYTAQRCRKCGGDEFDVFDTEHLPARMNLLEFYKNAEQLAELDSAGTLEQITVLAAWLGTTDLADLIEYDENNYCGQWEKFQDYAEQYADETGDLAAIPEYLQTYFDHAKFARDLEHDYYYDDATGHTWRSC